MTARTEKMRARSSTVSPTQATGTQSPNPLLLLPWVTSRKLGCSEANIFQQPSFPHDSNSNGTSLPKIVRPGPPPPLITAGIPPASPMTLRSSLLPSQLKDQWSKNPPDNCLGLCPLLTLPRSQPQAISFRKPSLLPAAQVLLVLTQSLHHRSSPTLS